MRIPPAAVLGLILVSSFGLKLVHLNHLALKPLDESFHALVAKNLLERPFTPTLIADPYLPYDHRDWQNNHVWLHKGTVPLWQIALSYLVFGINTFALRVPSAVLGTLAVLLTYLIGRELLDRTAAMVAAALQAFSPAIVMLVLGYVFSDHVDVALLFWVELGIWLTIRATRTGAMSDAVFAGVAQGLAFLSKMYPALIVTGVALAAWLLPAMLRARSGDTKFHRRHFAAMLLATIATAAPWLIACAVRFPDEFRHEYLFALQHLTHDIEQWGAPWDRVIFAHLLGAFYVFYPAVLVAAVLLCVRAVRQKKIGLWIVLAWAFGVLIPFTVATSKTPSATLIGWPALFLLFGAMVSRAVSGDRLMLGAWLGAIVSGVFVRGEMNTEGLGGVSGEILRQNIWVLWHVLGAIACGVALQLLPVRLPRAGLRGMIVLAAAGTLWLFGLWTHTAWRVTQMNIIEPAFVETARFIRERLPDNAVILLEEVERHERNTLMFRSGRTAYPLDRDGWRDHALDILLAGGVPLVVSDRDWPLLAIFRSERDGRTVYQLTPADLGLAP